MLRPVFLVCAAFACGPLARPVLPQTVIPVGQSAPILPPAIDRDGRIIAFGAAVNPDGTPQIVPDLWVWNSATNAVHRLTNYASTGGGTSAATSFTLSADGSQVAYVASTMGSQVGEIHVMDAASGSDRLLATDRRGCAQPLVVCAGCFFPCVHDPHFTPDGRVLYAASSGQAFYVVGADGQVAPLPVYSGYLASGPRRVISDNGLLVFVSSAPSGPPSAAAPWNVYLMNVDGSGLRNLTQFSNVNVYVQDAVISAGGGTIAFTGNGGSPDASAPSQVFAINADGTGLRQLTSGPDAAANPSLSGDGSLVAFQQSGQIHVSPAGGGSPASSLTSFRYSTAQDACISDDASQVAFTIGPNARGAVYEAFVTGGASHPVYAPLSLNSGGVTGVAGWEPPSPGALISLYGLNFSGDETAVASSFPLPPTLDRVSLLVNGEHVPVEAVTPWQINAQLPQNTPPGNVTFQVVSNGVASNTVTEQVPSSAASVFAFSGQNAQAGTSYWQAAAYHSGTGTPADAAHPAAAGEILETYGSGLGLTNPMVPAGVPSPAAPLARAIVIPQVTIGFQPAQVAFAGLVPGLAGVYQINVAVPDGLTPGQQSLNWTYDNGASIFVK